jgi:PAS domain-containing protein
VKSISFAVQKEYSRVSPASPCTPSFEEFGATTDMNKRSEDFNYSRILVQESLDAMFALSPSGEILFCNHGAETTFGYDREEMIGRRLEDLTIPDGLRA